MGTWGASLYDADFAGDLKNTIALVSKVPVAGDRLLELLLQMQGDVDLDDEEGTLFWLVVADQFEKKGIESGQATSNALRIIQSGTDLAACKARGADEKFLKARQKALLELDARLRQPRALKARPKAQKPPPLVLSAGEVYAFPTMAGRAWHPYRLPSDGPFVADGWGALVVLATGRAFEWLPWVALASLTVRSDRKPSFDDALKGQLIPHPQTNGAGRFVPKSAHTKGLQLELLGRIDLDPVLVEPQLSSWKVERAIGYDWTIAYGALSASIVGRGATAGVVLGSLCGKR
jgi:hypothetical protein